MAELTRSEEMFARALGRKAASSVGSSVAYSSGNGSATVYRETGRVTCVYSEGRLDVNLGSDDSPLMIESVPYTTACEGVQAGDTVIIETFGHRMVAVGVVSTSSDPQYRPATKAEMDEVDRNAEQAKADAAAAKELTDSVSSKLDAAEKSLDAVQAEAKQAKSDSETALAEARKTGQMAVTATAYEYAASASPTEAPSTGWGADVPAHREGEYTWMRVTLTYGDGRSETTEPVLLTGNAGAKGDKGDTGPQGPQGEKGADGAKGETGATGPQGEKGEKGDPGAPGKDGETGPQGVSVASVTTFWQLSASQPATPSGAADPSGWSTTEPEVPDGYSGSEWRCIRTVLSNGAAAWTVPTRSASFSYAHKAYQTAQGAVSTANSAKSTAEGVSATLTRDYTPTADADKRYSTKAELSAKADEISSSVKETYATKAAVSTAQSAADAAKSAAGTAQSTADTAKSSAAAANSAASSAASAAKSAQSTADAAKANAKTAQDGVDALKNRVTTAETSIKQNSDAIALRATKTEVTSAVDDIKVGGRNLLSNEMASKFNGANATIGYDSSTRTFTVTTSDTASTLWGNGIHNVGQVRVPYGKTLCVSFEIFTSTSAEWRMDVNNSLVGDPTWTGGSNDNDNVSARKHYTEGAVSYGPVPINQWVKCWFVYENTNTANTGKYDLVDSSNWGLILGNNTVYKIRNVKYELGNKPTDWSPAPEDLEGYAETYTDAQVKVSADSITSSVAASYVSNDDAAGFARKTELTQLSDSFTAKISNTQKQVDAQGETVRNVEDYMTFAQESGQPTLTIGTSSSKFNTKLTNTGQRFMNGTDTVMELDGPSSTVSAQRLKIGKYRLQQSADGERLRIAYLG